MTPAQPDSEPKEPVTREETVTPEGGDEVCDSKQSAPADTATEASPVLSTDVKSASNAGENVQPVPPAPVDYETLARKHANPFPAHLRLQIRFQILSARIAELEKVIKTKMEHPGWNFEVTCGANDALRATQEPK